MIPNVGKPLMDYSINDKNLIVELCSDESIHLINEEKNILVKSENLLFVHPLDDQIVGDNGELTKLIKDSTDIFSYSEVERFDALWKKLIEKAIQCLEYFDNSELYQDDRKIPFFAYGIDDLEEYHNKYIEYERIKFGSDKYYRISVFHDIRVWMLGLFFLMKRNGEKDTRMYSKLDYDESSHVALKRFNIFECLSMWTIVALCHDLGYPLEDFGNIIDIIIKMMGHYIPIEKAGDIFGFRDIYYRMHDDIITDYILKFISTKMVCKADCDDTLYIGRLQPKYYLKYVKSFEYNRHGIISSIIIFKMLLYFLKIDFYLNDDYVYDLEHAQRLYIRRDILRAMASHSCYDIYFANINTIPFLLFICDELSEWDRKTCHEHYIGIDENTVKLTINDFKNDLIDVSVEIIFLKMRDEEFLISNICRIFERQYSLYIKMIRDGSNNGKRNIELKKQIIFKFEPHGNNDVNVSYVLQKDGVCHFVVNLACFHHKKKTEINQRIVNKLANSMYLSTLDVIIGTE